jgi:hypothetical protein
MPAGRSANADRTMASRGERDDDADGLPACIADRQDGDVGKIQPGGQGGVDHLPQRVHIVGGDPFEKGDQCFRKQRRVVEHIQDVLDFQRLRLRRGRSDQISGDHASAKRHQHPLSRTCLCGEMGRYTIGEGVMDRQGHGNGNHLPMIHDLIFLDSGHGIF